MKRIISIFMCLLICAGLLTSCSQTQNNANSKLKIVTTIFPLYDWTRNILGEKIDSTELIMLLDSGADLHNFQPTADDIIKVSTCDVFIYVGGESDVWVDDILKDTENDKMIIINLFDVLDENMKEEEEKEGMQSHEEASEDENEIEYDEHIWLSLKNAKTICEYLTEKICQADEANQSIYKTNEKAYIEKIDSLDKEYAKTVENSKIKTLLFGDRFPFRYMTDDYGLDYYAAFKGCSSESEASFETVSFLAKKVDELSLRSVITIDSSDQKIAKTIINNTITKDQKILSLNSMQTITSQQVKDGADYVSIMTSNLQVLKEALQ